MSVEDAQSLAAEFGIPSAELDRYCRIAKSLRDTRDERDALKKELASVRLTARHVRKFLAWLDAEPKCGAGGCRTIALCDVREAAEELRKAVR